MTDKSTKPAVVTKRSRTPEQIAARGAEAGLGIVALSVPGDRLADLRGAETEEEAVIVAELCDRLGQSEGGVCLSSF